MSNITPHYDPYSTRPANQQTVVSRLGQPQPYHQYPQGYPQQPAQHDPYAFNPNQATHTEEETTLQKVQGIVNKADDLVMWVSIGVIGVLILIGAIVAMTFQ